MLILLQKVTDWYSGNSSEYLVHIYAFGLKLSLTGQNISSNSITMNTVTVTMEFTGQGLLYVYLWDYFYLRN